jgi:hypothetical protein
MSIEAQTRPFRRSAIGVVSITIYRLHSLRSQTDEGNVLTRTSKDVRPRICVLWVL